MTNIELAQVFEDAVGHLKMNRSDSSCYAISAVSGYSVYEAFGAWEESPIVKMLKTRVFRGKEYSGSWIADRAPMRPLWLTFLAELAERGDLTMDGLV